MESKRRYEHLLACIDATLSEDRPATPEAGIRTSLCSNGSLDVDAYESTLTRAGTNGDVIQGSGYVTLAEDREHVIAAIEYVADHTDAPQAFVREANLWLDG